MSRIWNPTTKIAAWSVLGFGGAALIYDGVFQYDFGWPQIFKGALFFALAIVMIGYAIKERRERNASNR